MIQLVATVEKCIVKDIVSLKDIEHIQSNRRLYKTIFKNKIAKDYKQVTASRWEAAMLIGEANKFAIEYEKKLGKKREDITIDEYIKMKDLFFEDKLHNMTHEEADELAKHIEYMYKDILI